LPQRRGSALEPPFASGGWELRSQPPALLLPPTLTTLSSSFLALNAFHYPQKRRKQLSKCSSLLLSQFSTNISLQTLQFSLMGGHKNISCPRAQGKGTLATPVDAVVRRCILGEQAVYPSCWPNLTKKKTFNRTMLCWSYGRYSIMVQTREEDEELQQVQPKSQNQTDIN